MTRVAVLCGGTSPERSVSLHSGAAVAKYLQLAGYAVTEIDYTGELPALQADVVFPILHGSGGEDGTVQAQLDATGLPYLGSGVAASQLCFDKWLYKDFLRAHDIPNAPGELVTAQTFADSPLSQKPYVLKPMTGGSSVDTIVARQPNMVDARTLANCFDQYSEMLLEQLIDGTEITVGIVGDVALPVIEIIPPSGGEFDFTNKYNGQTQELCPPQHITPAVQRRAQALAKQIHQLTGCRDFSRTDMIIDASGNPLVLETNTIPGMTDQSLLPKAAAVGGLPFTALVDRLVQLALSRKLA